MAEKTSVWPTLLIVGIVALLVGGLFGAFAFPTTEVVNKEVKVEKIVTVEVPVEKIVEVQTNVPTALLETSVDDLLAYLDDEDLLVCDSEDYNLNEATVKKVYDEFSIEYSDDDEYTVFGKAKVSYKQEDVARCSNTYNYSVFYEEGEDPVVTIL